MIAASKLPLAAKQTSTKPCSPICAEEAAPTVSSTPADFDAFIRSETERWSKVLKENANVKLD